jgi:pilus assembly protein CpaB
MNTKALIPLAAGLGIGGFALWMGINTLQSARAAPQPVATVDIWAAKGDIPRGTRITEEMIDLLRFPTELVPEGAFPDGDAPVGRVARLESPGGLPILESMLLEPGAPAGLFVKPGFRGVAVQIDAGSGVDYHLEPGCFVDVVGSFTVRREGRHETLAKTILENVEVAAVGARVSPVRSSDEEGRVSSRVVRAVTLFVKPNDVPKLLLAEQKGRIKLSRRSDDDTGRLAKADDITDVQLTGQVEKKNEDHESAGSLLDRLRGMFADPAPELEPIPPLAVAVPAPRVATAWEVAIIRGQNKETVRFKNRNSREPAEEEFQRMASVGGSTPRPVVPPPGPPSNVVPPIDDDELVQNDEAEPKEPEE